VHSTICNLQVGRQSQRARGFAEHSGQQRTGASRPLPKIDHPGVSLVCLADPTREAIHLLGNYNQVYVIRHQAPCPETQSVPFSFLGEGGQIVSSITIREEDRQRANTALGQMMRNTRQDNSRNPGHVVILGGNRHSYKIPTSKTTV